MVSVVCVDTVELVAYTRFRRFPTYAPTTSPPLCAASSTDQLFSVILFNSSSTLFNLLLSLRFHFIFLALTEPHVIFAIIHSTLLLLLSYSQKYDTRPRPRSIGSKHLSLTYVDVFIFVYSSCLLLKIASWEARL